MWRIARMHSLERMGECQCLIPAKGAQSTNTLKSKNKVMGIRKGVAQLQSQIPAERMSPEWKFQE